MDLVSVILPFYNAQKHLKRCIHSILSQTNPNFELILVNDGSTDHGKYLCNSFAARDHRVKLINLEQNSGVSHARNVGMDHSSGDYLVFVDSDDWIDREFLEIMLSRIKESKADLVSCSHINRTRQGESLFQGCREDTVMSNRDAIIGLFQNKYVQPAVWGKLFKKEIIDNHILRFDEDISMSEDIKFVYEYLSFCSFCCMTKYALYWYVADNPNSAMNSDKRHTEFNEKWLSAWTSYVRMGQHTSKYFNEDRAVERVFLCSQTSAARMKLHLLLEYCCSNHGIYRELLNFIRQHIFLFIKYDYSKVSRKIMIGICALSPKLEYTLWRHIRSGE